MKRLFSALVALSVSLAALAQDTPLETGRSFMRSGDFDNAVLVMTRGLQADPKNIELQKELAMALYLKRDYPKALDIVDMLLDQPNVDVPSYQIAGNVYKALERVKDAEKTYKNGLHKFPKSGPLYSEYGELLWAKKDFNAIDQWEKGIKADPAFSGNYYNAALYYY
ncbi:MAG: tetratricopeptide repeat protein, partial [Sphingobacteriales bacterium]